MGSQIVGHDLHAWTHIKYRYRKPDKTNISLRELLQARNPCNYHPSLVFFFFKNGLLSSNPSQLTSLSLHPREVLGFPCGSPGKQSTHNAGDLGLVLGLGRSPGEGKGYPVQYSSLENSMDRGAWWATVHGITKSRTQLKRLSTCALPIYTSFCLLPEIKMLEDTVLL